MKTRQSTRYFQQVYIRLLFCFISSVVFAASAYALTGNLIDQCSDCHGTNNVPGPADIRPNDLTYRNITTGAFVGNHRTHMATVTNLSNVCTPCHGPAPAAMDHRNSVITMRQHINSSATTRGTYGKGIFINQTSAFNTVNATCNNVNCHFQKTTLTWGSPAYSYASASVNDCDQCHGNGALSAPQDGSHPGFSTNKHGLYYGTDVTSCAKCHADHTVATNKFAHASSAGNRSLILNGTSFTSTSYSKAATNLAYPAYLTTAPASRNGTCTTFYCHSPGTGGTKQADGRSVVATAVLPTWGGTVDCTSCHTGGTTTGPTYATTVKANLHPSHTKAGVAYTCDVCHFNVTSNGTTIANYSKHVNGFYNVSANTAKTGAFAYTYASTGGACKTSTCHGGAGINLAWSASRGTTQCTKCHGTQSAAIGTIWSSASVAPGSATGGDLAGNLNISVRGGVHQGHLTAATNISDKIHCGECHKVVTTVNAATHMLYTTSRPAFTGNLATAQSHTPSVTRTSGIINCNNTYCHTGKLNTGVAMTPAWNNATYLSGTMTMTDCKQCHNMPPNPGVAGVHSAIPAALTAFPVGTTCNCHSNLTTGGTTYATIFTDKTKHINGNIEGGHAFPYPGATHDGATGATTPAASCSGTSCHNVVAAGPYPVAAGIAPNCMGCHTVGILRTVATVSCYDCHGSGPAAATAWPNATVFPNNNRSHTAHTAITGITCDYCHTGGGTGTATHGGSNRIAKTQANVVVALGAQAGTAATWTLGTETCGTSVCHGQKSPAWGITASTTQCTKCHGQANAAYANTSSALIAPGGAGRDTGGKTLATDPRVGTHQAHLLASSNISDKMHCGECHVKVNAVSDPTHLNYTTATVTFQNALLAKKGTVAHNPNATKVSGIINCNNTYCHTGNYAGGTAPTPVWNNSTLLAGTISDCTKCHLLPPTPGAGSHATKAAVTTIAGLNVCSSQPGGITGCHPSINGTPTTYLNIFFDKLLHINGSVEGGTCVGCHAAVLASPVASGLGGPANRRNVVAEHKNVWSHKRSSAGGVPANTVVTNADCIVCHMEGDKASGGTTGVHKDGYIDLRDPDTGLQIKNVTWNNATPGAYVAGATDLRFVQFSRNLAVRLEADPNWLVIAAIQQNHCLKCHDTNGANNLNAQVPTGATAWKPFGVAIIGHTAPLGSNGSGNVVDVNKSFLTSNATYHPVTGKQNNGFPDSNLLTAPWNVKTGAGTAAVYGPLMSCWDCHAPAGAAGAQTMTVTAHGGPATLRSPIWVSDSTAAGNLCLVCHSATEYPDPLGNGNHGANSAFTIGKSNMRGDMPLCQNCHSTFTDARPVRAEDVHGFNDKTPGTAGSKWTSGSRPYAFFRTSQLGDWAPKAAAGDTILKPSTCNSGSCSNNNMNGIDPIVGVGGTY